MGLSFRTKLLLSFVGLVVAVVVLASVELNYSLSNDLMRRLDERLEAQALGAATWVGTGRHPNRRAGRLANMVGAEITLIEPGGAVSSFAQPTPEAVGAPTAEPEDPDTTVPALP